MTDTNQQHPMWHVHVSRSDVTDETDFFAERDVCCNLRAPTASAALARAEAMRAGAAAPDAAVPTIRVRACIAVVNGKQWGVIGCHEWSDRAMAAQAHDIAGVFQSDNVQIDYVTVDVPLRQPAELTGRIERKVEP